MSLCCCREAWACPVGKHAKLDEDPLTTVSNGHGTRGTRALEIFDISRPAEACRPGDTAACFSTRHLCTLPLSLGFWHNGCRICTSPSWDPVSSSKRETGVVRCGRVTESGYRELERTQLLSKGRRRSTVPRGGRRSTLACRLWQWVGTSSLQ